MFYFQSSDLSWKLPFNQSTQTTFNTFINSCHPVKNTVSQKVWAIVMWWKFASEKYWISIDSYKIFIIVSCLDFSDNLICAKNYLVFHFIQRQVNIDEYFNQL